MSSFKRRQMGQQGHGFPLSFSCWWGDTQIDLWITHTKVSLLSNMNSYVNLIFLDIAPFLNSEASYLKQCHYHIDKWAQFHATCPTNTLLLKAVDVCGCLCYWDILLISVLQVLVCQCRKASSDWLCGPKTKSYLQHWIFPWVSGTANRTIASFVIINLTGFNKILYKIISVRGWDMCIFRQIDFLLIMSNIKCIAAFEQNFLKMVLHKEIQFIRIETLGLSRFFSPWLFCEFMIFSNKVFDPQFSTYFKMYFGAFIWS